MLINVSERGDTIIEVLFAITIFSLVAVVGLMLMNEGTAIAERSLEITLVREQMDAQTDALRYLRDAYVADNGSGGQATTTWHDVTARALLSGVKAEDFTAIANGSACVPPTIGQAFTLDITKLNANPILTPTAKVATYAKLRYDVSPTSAEGIWIQAVPGINNSSAPGQPSFYDFHIRACWQSGGAARPVTLGTIVRLYVPQA